MALTEKIRSNREMFLSELRSGKYKKGTIKSDDKGKPIIASPEDADGCCACAIMYHLFPDDGGKNSIKASREALGLTAKACGFIQQELNDTPLSFPEIADRIESELFTLKIKETTPFSKIQEYYPNALSLTMSTNKVLSNHELLCSAYGPKHHLGKVLKNNWSATSGAKGTKVSIRAVVYLLDIADVKAAVLKAHPLAYATYGIQMFTNKELWRIEDGNGKALIDMQGNEERAWANCAKLLKLV